MRQLTLGALLAALAPPAAANAPGRPTWHRNREFLGAGKGRFR
jgi:hypothetical protein